MAANKQLLVLPGDGIGPEVMGQVLRVVDWFDKRRAVRFDLKEGLVGGASLDKNGTPISDETMAGRNGTPIPSTRSPSAASCACGRKWTSSPICVRQPCSMRWSMRRR
jgi:Isocitrate/isopropylmalate dehydrogenase